MEAETHVNYVIEARKGNRSWLQMQNAGPDEEQGKAAYASWLASRDAKGFSLRYRMVKRTAVVTDEVVLEEPEPPQVPDIPPHLLRRP